MKIKIDNYNYKTAIISPNIVIIDACTLEIKKHKLKNVNLEIKI